MGGGWVPHTFPQVLAAASVFLANVSEYHLPFPHQLPVLFPNALPVCLSGNPRVSIRGGPSANVTRHLRWILDHQTDVGPLPSTYRSTRVLLVVRHPRRRLRGWVRMGLKYRFGRFGPGGILPFDPVIHWCSYWSIIAGKSPANSFSSYGLILLLRSLGSGRWLTIR